MFSWSLLIGLLVYTIIGPIIMNMVYDYIDELESKVAMYDPRYCERLRYHIKVKRTRLNEFLVDVIFIAFWPVICIAAILKAENEYDIIVHQHAFRRKVL